MFTMITNVVSKHCSSVGLDFFLFPEFLNIAYYVYVYISTNCGQVCRHIMHNMLSNIWEIQTNDGKGFSVNDICCNGKRLSRLILKHRVQTRAKKMWHIIFALLLKGGRRVIAALTSKVIFP